MMSDSLERIIYSLNVEDIQTVCSEQCHRELTEEEIKLVEAKVGDYIDWYEALLAAIQDVAPDAIGDSADDYEDEEE